MEKEKVKCSDCDKLFRDRFNLWRHFMRKHCPDHSKRERHKTEKPKPVCTLCGKIFYKNGNLKRHARFCKKRRSSSSEDFTFANTTEFEEWKTRIERETLARFVRKSHYKLQNGSMRTKFCCHRSGYFKSNGRNIRRLKVIGSNKINGICPAKIISIVSPEGKVEVSFYPNHNGHNMELQRITLSKSERAEIAQKIANKIPFKEILNNIKNAATDSGLKRIHLLTKKDLHNIEKEFNINSSISYQYTHVENFLEESPNALNTTIDPLRFIEKPASDMTLIPLEPSNCNPSQVLEQVEGSDQPIQQPQSFVIPVPYTDPEPVHQEDLFTTHIQDENMINKLKDEIRREFELVFSSIVNEEQALNDLRLEPTENGGRYPESQQFCTSQWTDAAAPKYCWEMTKAIRPPTTFIPSPEGRSLDAQVFIT